MYHANQYLKNISTLKIPCKENCVGCGACVSVCPHNVLEVKNGKVHVMNKDACMECGACAMNCAFGVIEVNAGVGCAHAVINGMLRKTSPSCDCSGGNSKKNECCG